MQNQHNSYHMPIESSIQQQMKMNYLFSNSFEHKNKPQGYFPYNPLLSSFPMAQYGDSRKPSFSQRYGPNYMVTNYMNPNGFNQQQPHNQHVIRPPSISLAGISIQSEAMNKPKISLPPIKNLIEKVDNPQRRNSESESSVCSDDMAPNHITDKLNEEYTKNTCTTCFKSFKKPSTLKRHLITHTNIKPFECTYCGRAFNVKHNLVRHKKRHDEISQQAVKNVLVNE